MPAPVPLEDLPRARLEAMAAAGADVQAAAAALTAGGLNPVGQMLRDHLGAGGTFYEMEHYPSGDVYDPATHAQYYYHTHRPEGGEHGHFHTFLRAQGMPGGIEPAPDAGSAERPLGADALSHLIAIAMNRPGQAISLFAVNRWVTGETFYRAADVIAMLDRFAITHAAPCWATNRWLTGMVGLFRPQIEALLIERDQVIADRQARKPGVDVFEDRSLEVTGSIAIDVDRQVAAVARALQQARAAA